MQRNDFFRQMRDVKAHTQAQHNQYILRESRSIASVGRDDHRIMTRLLVAEAYRQDQHKLENRDRWKHICAEVDLTSQQTNHMFAVSPDPYSTNLATLSSMCIWNDDVREWTFGYTDATIIRRRTKQFALLEELQRRGALFLNPAPPLRPSLDEGDAEFARDAPWVVSAEEGRLPLSGDQLIHDSDEESCDLSSVE